MYYDEELRKFDVIYCDLGKNKGSIQSSKRYCIVVSNNRCCRHSPVITIVPCTTSQTKAKIPTHLPVEAKDGLKEPSIILGEQILTINKVDIQKKCGHISDKDVQEGINNILRIQLSLN